MRNCLKLFLCLVIICVILYETQAATKKTVTKRKNSHLSVKQLKQINSQNCIRWATMRIIYGIATRMGLGEQFTALLNGSFVPPESPDDYGDYADFDSDDDYF